MKNHARQLVEHTDGQRSYYCLVIVNHMSTNLQMQHLKIVLHKSGLKGCPLIVLIWKYLLYKWSTLLVISQSWWFLKSKVQCDSNAKRRKHIALSHFLCWQQCALKKSKKNQTLSRNRFRCCRFIAKQYIVFKLKTTKLWNPSQKSFKLFFSQQKSQEKNVKNDIYILFSFA